MGNHTAYYAVLLADVKKFAHKHNADDCRPDDCPTRPFSLFTHHAAHLCGGQLNRGVSTSIGSNKNKQRQKNILSSVRLRATLAKVRFRTTRYTTKSN